MDDSFPEEIQKACRVGDVEALSRILNDHPDLLNSVDSKLRWSPLYRTVICGHIEATEFLLKQGADPNLKNNLGETPLHQATENSQAKLVKLLLKYKADPNSQQNDGNTPLHQSSYKGDESIVAMLLQYKADPNMENSVFGKTSLHYAVEYGHEEIIKLLMANNANPLLKDKTDRSPLDMAPPDVKGLLSRSPRSPRSDRSFQNSPLLLPSPEPVDAIPAIPMQSFTGLDLSPKTSIKPAGDYSEKPSFSTSTIFEPDAEKSQLDIRASKAFSFGGCDGRSLALWLDSMKLEFLFEKLMNAGYDDVDQMVSQMMSGMPITEENLEKIGIDKPGHRKRLLIALDEESRPYKSSRRTHRAQSNSFMKCCMAPVPANTGVVNLPDLEKWLTGIGLQYVYPKFEQAGYEDFEHLLVLMNSRFEINDGVLMNEVGIVKQAHRFKIIDKLKTDCAGFDSMKKGGITSRYRRDELAIERNANSTACSSCLIN
jgi:hypothetical protein